MYTDKCELWNLAPVARCRRALQFKITLVTKTKCTKNFYLKKRSYSTCTFLREIALGSFGNCWLNIWIWFWAHRAYFIHYINHTVNKWIPQSFTLLRITKMLRIKCSINMQKLKSSEEYYAQKHNILVSDCYIFLEI